jgi:hypothetical protein
MMPWAKPERILLAIIAALLFILITAIALGDSSRKDGDIIKMSTVRWGEVEASVPELIMRDMGLKPGQEIDDETAKDVTERIVRQFKLEKTK